MTYGYIRVSTDRQTVENQRFEIKKFCGRNEIEIGKWIEETISGTKKPEKRRLGLLLRDIKAGDLIVCSELSRLGRSLFMIMNILSYCLDAGARVWTVKDGYRLGDDIQSKVLAFAFGLSAEIERDLISQRTREALRRRRAEGKRLGRPPGAAVRLRLDGRENHALSRRSSPLSARISPQISEKYRSSSAVAVPACLAISDRWILSSAFRISDFFAETADSFSAAAFFAASAAHALPSHF